MSVCTLGTGLFPPVEYPGPVVSYTWNRYVLPAWLVEQLHDETLAGLAGLEAAVVSDILANATPNREPLEWGAESELRFMS